MYCKNVMIIKGNIGIIFGIISGFNRCSDLLLLWPALPWVSRDKKKRTATFSVCFSVTVLNLPGRKENSLHLTGPSLREARAEAQYRNLKA